MMQLHGIPTSSPVRVTALVLLCATTLARADTAPSVDGELKTWHKVTLTFDGPRSFETAEPNPFLDYRLTVTFRHESGGRAYVVPGYFAADGNAAETGARRGNKWRVHFAPDRSGTWSYRVSFRKGEDIAVSGDAEGASAGFMDGASGELRIDPTDKTGRDLRAKGLLRYVGKHHLRFAGTGEYFLKCGADAPENFLAYADFDGDFKSDGRKDDFVKTWEPHIRDWRPGDPTWRGEKGKGIVGAINYLASQGMNAFSFLTLNIGGDDRNVFPYTTYDERERLDCSRLDQWAIVLEHGNAMGMFLHFKTQETENELLLDGGDLGRHRKLYYRELIARFGHNLALNWNLGEEVNDATHEQKAAWADYFWTHDPYQHPIVIHNGSPHYDLLGDRSALTGFSLQTSRPDFRQVHRRTRDYLERSRAAGKPWVVACDEPGDASHALTTDAEDPTRDEARKNALWGNIMAGGAGVEWYFGYQHPHSDLTCQDYRTRKTMWTQCRYALELFEKQRIPFSDMECADEMTASEDDYVLRKPGEVYLVYLKRGGAVDIEVTSGGFDYSWFNPRTGEGIDGLLRQGSVEGKRQVSAPDGNDWLLVLRGKGELELSADDPPAARAVPTSEGTVVLEALEHFRIVEGGGFVPAYEDRGHEALAIDPVRHQGKFAAAEAVFPGDPGVYDVTLTTLAETDGESTYRLFVDGRRIGKFTNPETRVDYEPTTKTWEKVSLDKGAKLRVEFNTATNSKVDQGDRKGWSRGRWRSLAVVPREKKVGVRPPKTEESPPVARPTRCRCHPRTAPRSTRSTRRRRGSGGPCS